MLRRPHTLIDFAETHGSPWFSQTHGLSLGGVHISRGILVPNPGTAVGAPQLTAVIHEGEPFEMEWQEPDTGRLRQMTVRPGAVHVNPGHRPFYQRWAAKPRIMVMAFEQRLVEQIGATFGGRTGADIATVIGRRDAEIETLAARLRREVLDGGAHAKLAAEALAVALLIHLFRAYRRTPHPVSPVKGGLEPIRLAHVLNYIDEHLTEKITVGELAAIAGLSAHHFNTSFKTVTGTPPIKFVLRRRLERAMDALAMTDRTIAEIALDLGFPSHGHLSTYFKRELGTQPSRYRSDWRQRLARAAGEGPRF